MYAPTVDESFKLSYLRPEKRRGGQKDRSPLVNPAGVYTDACFTIYSNRFQVGMQRLAHHPYPFRNHPNQLIRSRHHPLQIMGRHSCKEHKRRRAGWSAIAAQRGLAILLYRDGPYLQISLLYHDKSENFKAHNGFLANELRPQPSRQIIPKALSLAPMFLCVLI